MTKILKVELTAAIVLIGFFMAVVFHYILNFYYNVPYPLNSFLFYGKSFSDFYNDYLSAEHLMPYMSTYLNTNSFPIYMATSSTSVYFPVSYLLVYPFTFISPQISALFHSLLFTCIIGIFVKYYLSYDLPIQSKQLNCFLMIKNTFILTVMTYPVLFSFERGNAELMLFTLLVIFLFFYMKKHYIKSGLFLAAAIGMKIYPAVFLILFLADKKYKPFTICLLLTFLLTCIALFIYKGTISHQLQVLVDNLNFFKVNFIDTRLAIASNSSYFSVLETIHRIKQHIPSTTAQPQSLTALRNYALFACLFFSGIVLYILYIEKILWKKIALLTASMILLPYISFDHKLLHVYLPFFIFVNTLANIDTKSYLSKSDILYTVIFALLLIPKNYYSIYWVESIGSMLNTALLTLLVILIIVEGCWNRKQKTAETLSPYLTDSRILRGEKD